MGKMSKQFVCGLGSQFSSEKQTFDEMYKYYASIHENISISSKYDQFIDDQNRKVLFRGINVAAKIPLYSHKKDPELVSFTNTPFTVEEATEHFTRLKYLGFNLLRWVVPWEALCPNEPEGYDKKYLDYLDNVVALAGDYGFSVLIDFHQDVWSRFTGGSGAPLWTIEKVGMDPHAFEDSLAAIRHGKKTDFPLGHLFWATNADRYAAKTMYTLFFGGKTFTPSLKIEGANVQDYLQQHYLESITRCAKKLKGHDHIIGYDIMNEPGLGFLGCKDLSKYHGLFRLGPSPTPLQAFALAEGNTQEIDIFEKRMFGLKSVNKTLFNKAKTNIFHDGVCIWRKQGVWGYHDKKPVLLRRNFFSSGSANEHFYVPFIKKACKELSSINSKKINFIEHATNHHLPNVKKLPFTIGFSGHWYDAFVISMRKVWNFISVDMITQKVKVSLPHFVQKNLSSQIFRLLKKVEKFAGKVPFLLSEFGIPFDLNNKKAYESGNYAKQKEGLERSFKAVEKTMVSSIIWNYTATNSNEKGDLWNAEDFSIFSVDQIKNKEDPYSGIRAKEAIVRPYPIKVPGVLKSYSFDSHEGFFSMTFDHDKKNLAPVEIFLPTIHFAKGFELQTSKGHFEVSNKDQKLYFYPESHKSTSHKIYIYRKRTLKEVQENSLPFI